MRRLIRSVMKCQLIRLAACAAVLSINSLVFSAEPAGVLPNGADGKPLNFDFEQGSLKDWAASGDAFEKQPIKGDTVSPRRNDMKSQHQGEYWIGTFENGRGDKAQGTLTSAPFKVEHGWASFLVGGGSGNKTRVEILNAASGHVLFRATGPNDEKMRAVSADLRAVMGAKIQVRLVDEATTGWGHVNFDDFAFHDTAPARADVLASTSQ